MESRYNNDLFCLNFTPMIRFASTIRKHFQKSLQTVFMHFLMSSSISQGGKDQGKDITSDWRMSSSSLSLLIRFHYQTPTLNSSEVQNRHAESLEILPQGRPMETNSRHSSSRSNLFQRNFQNLTKLKIFYFGRRSVRLTTTNGELWCVQII